MTDPHHAPFVSQTPEQRLGAVGFRVVHAGSLASAVKRSVFIVDEAGIVRYRDVGTVKAIFKQPQALAKILAAI